MEKFKLVKNEIHYSDNGQEFLLREFKTEEEAKAFLYTLSTPEGYKKLTGKNS